MPYNNTPIAPPKEVSGQVSLPLARVQKIINADQDRTHVSKNASFAIALATEMFIQHLATTTHNVVKAERKPRRNIQYRDVSSAVAKTDNLEFLVDVAPRTTTYGEFKKKQEGKPKPKAAAGASSPQNKPRKRAGPSGMQNLLADPAENGNGALDHSEEPDRGGLSGADDHEANIQASEVMDIDDVEEENAEDNEPDPVAMQIEVEMRGPRANGSDSAQERTSGFTAINGGK